MPAQSSDKSKFPDMSEMMSEPFEELDSALQDLTPPRIIVCIRVCCAPVKRLKVPVRNSEIWSLGSGDLANCMVATSHYHVCCLIMCEEILRATEDDCVERSPPVMLASFLG